MKHIISATPFSRDDIEKIFARADEFAKGNAPQLLAGKSAALYFYEPSVRARASFESAIKALGGGVLPGGNENPARYADAVRAASASTIVFRHPETGAAQIAADASSVPLINAGDGAGEDPTQALAELYTLRAEKKTINGLRVALVGDLKNGRIAHSLALLLAQYDVYLSLVTPAAMSLPYDLSDAVRARGITVEETNDIERVLAKADAVILARVEKKFWDDAARYAKMSQFYRVDAIAANKRVEAWLGGSWDGADEILAEAYKKTSANALWVRMAVLAEIMQ